MTHLKRIHLEPQTGAGLVVTRGELLKIIDPEGEQVSDLTSFARDDPAEWLSSGRTIDYANTIYLTTGHTLYSNRSRPMWTIVEDTVGRHDFSSPRARPTPSASSTASTHRGRAASPTSRSTSRHSGSAPT
jgi:uncharacterized protein YcgI (DUF1989 family)